MPVLPTKPASPISHQANRPRPGKPQRQVIRTAKPPSGVSRHRLTPTGKSYLLPRIIAYTAYCGLFGLLPHLANQACKPSQPSSPTPTASNCPFLVRKHPEKRQKKDGPISANDRSVRKYPASCYSPIVKFTVPSPLGPLTTVFGKGTCVTAPLWTPEKNQQ